MLSCVDCIEAADPPSLIAPVEKLIETVSESVCALAVLIAPVPELEFARLFHTEAALRRCHTINHEMFARLIGPKRFRRIARQ